MSVTVENLKLLVVETRPAWGDPWTPRPYLEVNGFDKTLSPTIPTARLEWRYGRVSESGAAYRTREPLLDELLGHHVRICRPATEAELSAQLQAEEDLTLRYPVWHGILMAGTDAMGAALQEYLGDGETLTGLEGPVARGYAALLHRDRAWHSVVSDGAGGTRAVDALLPFNLWDGHADQLVGNRSAAKVANPASGLESYVFSATDGETWSARDVLEYYLSRWGPVAPPLSLAGATGNLDARSEAWGHFATAGEALNRLAARNRGHAWCVRVATAADGTETATVQICPTFGQEIVAGGATLSPATAQWTLDAEAESIESVRVLHSDESRYDVVLVRGGPILVCTTLSFADGTLEAGWAAAQETAFKAADAIGRTAEKFRHVYTTYTAVTDSMTAGPTCPADGEIDFSAGGAAEFWHGRRFLRRLPLLATADDAEGPAEHRAPFAVLSGDVDGETKWAFTDRLGEVFDGAPSWALELLDGASGARINAPGVHLSLNHMDGGQAGGAYQPFDYEDVRLTVAYASSEHIEVGKFTAGNEAEATDRVLQIDLPGTQAWVILDGTVTDVVDGALVTQDGDAVLRNDSDQLEAVAALAAAWYGRTRRSVQLGWRELHFDLEPGDYLQGLSRADGPVEANSVITRIGWSGESQQTKLTTDFGELDFRAMAQPRRGGPAGLAAPAPAAPDRSGAVARRDLEEKLPVRLPADGWDAGQIRFGKVTSGYSGQYIEIEIDPCDETGTDNGEATGNIYSSYDALTVGGGADLDLASGDQVLYLAFSPPVRDALETLGVLLGPVEASADYKVAVSNGDTAPDYAYEKIFGDEVWLYTRIVNSGGDEELLFEHLGPYVTDPNMETDGWEGYDPDTGALTVYEYHFDSKGHKVSFTAT